MKILVVTPWFPEPESPAHGLFVAQQTAELQLRGHEIDLFIVKPWMPAPVRMALGRYRPVPRAAVRWRSLDATCVRYLSFPRFAFHGGAGRRVAHALRGRIEKKSWAVVLAHTELVAEGVLRALAARTIPVVSVIHGINTAPGFLATRRRRANLAWTLKESSRVAVVGPRLVPVVEDWGAAPEAVRVVPNGFDPGLVGAASPKAGRSAVLSVLSVSNLQCGKGIDINLRALLQLRRSGIKVRYRIAGGGPEARRLKALAKTLEVADLTEFLGPLPPEAVHREMAACDVFSLPSSPEAFGIVYVEAMAHGRPIVGCRGEGAELVCRDREEGLLVPPDDADSVATAWRRLLDPDLRERMGGAGRRRAFAEFTWSRSASLMERVLCEAVAPGEEVSAEAGGRGAE